MNLYEINNEILSCLDLETGEILDFEKLEQLEMEKDLKIENIACWVKSLSAEVLAIKEEENSLKSRRQSKEVKIDGLKNYLNSALQGNKFESAKCVVSFRKSTQTKVDEEIFLSKHRDMCEEIVSYKYDKNVLKECIKQGNILEGVEIIENSSISIK